MINSTFTAVGTVGVSLGVFFNQVANEGIDYSTGENLGIIGSGVAVFLYQERKNKALRDEANVQRRSADSALLEAGKHKDTEIRLLKKRVDFLTDRIFELTIDEQEGD